MRNNWHCRRCILRLDQFKEPVVNRVLSNATALVFLSSMNIVWNLTTQECTRHIKALSPDYHVACSPDPSTPACTGQISPEAAAMWWEVPVAPLALEEHQERNKNKLTSCMRYIILSAQKKEKRMYSHIYICILYTNILTAFDVLLEH